MRKRIVTHPDNLSFVKKLVENQRKEEWPDDSFHMLFYPFEFQTNKFMEKERPTGRYEVLQNKFFTYWDGKGEPPSWALYCGFVKPIMEPLFYEIDIDRITMFRPDFGLKYNARLMIKNDS